jgi:hypothetical protein
MDDIFNYLKIILEHKSDDGEVEFDVETSFKH